MMSFKQWLLSQHKRNDDIGRLSADFRQDFRDMERRWPEWREWPEELTRPFKRFTPRTARKYLKEKNVSPKVLECLDFAVGEWVDSHISVTEPRK